MSLTDRDLHRAGDACIAEGVTVIRRLVDTGHPLVSVLVTPSRLDTLGPLPADVAVYVADQRVMNAVVGFDIHRGAVAVATRPPVRDAAELTRGADRIAVLEDISDLENMGLLFRSAAALGAEAVLLSPGCCDPLYRRPLRVSMGHALSVPFATLEPWPSALGHLRDTGHEVVALTPAVDAEPVERVRSRRRVALLLGAEGPGLSPGALAIADRRVRITMRPGIDSLNVAAAAAIAFHRLFVEP